MNKDELKCSCDIKRCLQQQIVQQINLKENILGKNLDITANAYITMCFLNLSEMCSFPESSRIENASSRTCYVLSAKICILLIKWGHFGEVVAFLLVVTNSKACVGIILWF